MGAYAVSPDRSVLALATLHNVLLYTADGARLGAPLRIDTPNTDGIAEVAFSADGNRLLARTVWTSSQWPVAPEPRPDAELDRLLAGLAQGHSPAQPLRIPSARWRATLRTHDPGPWPDAEQRPAPQVAGYAALDGSPIPARAPGTPDTLLDLTAFYTVGPDSARNSYATPQPFLRPYPAGVQRLGDVDFDIRGMVEVDRRGLANCLSTPETYPIAAIHALLNPTVRTPEQRTQQVAELILHYRDGGQARIPIRSGREVQGYADDSAVPLVFVTRMRAAMGLRGSTLAAPRLVNPEPERMVRCINLRTTGDPMLVLGLTVEPVQQERGPGVIFAPNFR